MHWFYSNCFFWWCSRRRGWGDHWICRQIDSKGIWFQGTHWIRHNQSGWPIQKDGFKQKTAIISAWFSIHQIRRCHQTHGRLVPTKSGFNKKIIYFQLFSFSLATFVIFLIKAIKYSEFILKVSKNLMNYGFCLSSIADLQTTRTSVHQHILAASVMLYNAGLTTPPITFCLLNILSER